MFSFSCPHERGVKVRVVCIGLFTAVAVGFRGHETDGGIVTALFSFVVVLLDGLFISFTCS